MTKAMDLPGIALKVLLSWSTSLLAGLALSVSTASQVSARPILTSLATALPLQRNCQQRADAVVTLYVGTEIGSGSIVASEGLILTSHHVLAEAVQQPAKTKIFVSLPSGDRYVGQIIGTDLRNDLALVQIPAQGLPSIPLARTERVQIGQQVCAIGSPLGQRGVLTQGTLMGLRNNNDLKTAIYLYGGNSGGPLLNAQGEMIGINKSIWVLNNGQNAGISFATNVRAAQLLLQRNPVWSASQVRSSPGIAATLPQIPFTAFSSPGLTLASAASGTRLGITVDQQNLMVRRVEVGSPAEMGGLQMGDRLVAVNGNPLVTLQQLQAFLNSRPASAVFTLDRQQQPLQVQVNFAAVDP